MNVIERVILYFDVLIAHHAFWTENNAAFDKNGPTSAPPPSCLLGTDEVERGYRKAMSAAQETFNAKSGTTLPSA